MSGPRPALPQQFISVPSDAFAFRFFSRQFLSTSFPVVPAPFPCRSPPRVSVLCRFLTWLIHDAPCVFFAMLLHSTPSRSNSRLRHSVAAHRCASRATPRLFYSWLCVAKAGLIIATQRLRRDIRPVAFPLPVVAVRCRCRASPFRAFPLPFCTNLS